MGVAQSVRAPGCGPGGHGFDSHHSPHFPLSAIRGWKPRFCSGFQLRNPNGRIILTRWDVAKLVRHQTLTLAFVGSSPAIPAIACKDASQEASFFHFRFRSSRLFRPPCFTCQILVHFFLVGWKRPGATIRCTFLNNCGNSSTSIFVLYRYDGNRHRSRRCSDMLRPQACRATVGPIGSGGRECAKNF